MEPLKLVIDAKLCVPNSECVCVLSRGTSARVNDRNVILYYDRN